MDILIDISKQLFSCCPYLTANVCYTRTYFSDTLIAEINVAISFPLFISHFKLIVSNYLLMNKKKRISKVMTS